jgi:hypothetical protein
MKISNNKQLRSKCHFLRILKILMFIDILFLVSLGATWSQILNLQCILKTFDLSEVIHSFIHSRILSFTHFLTSSPHYHSNNRRAHQRSKCSGKQSMHSQF